MKQYSDTKRKMIVAKEDLETFPHTWTKGLDYEIVEKEDYFTLASNEGQLNYYNTVKGQVLEHFILQD